MVIVIIIHQVADKSVYWKQAAQATKFGAIWLQLIGQEVWQKLSYFFDQLLKPHKSLRNPPDLVCSRNDYILWYKFQKFKKCKKVLGYALLTSMITEAGFSRKSWLWSLVWVNLSLPLSRSLILKSALRNLMRKVIYYISR